MPTTRSALAAAAMAALLVLAGCSGPVTTGTDGPADASGTTGDATTPADGPGVGGEGGTVEFYVSDEENAIDDFEHLNVTVTKVGLHRAGGDDAAEGDEEAAESGEPVETGTELNGTPDGATPTATLTPSPEEGAEDERDEADDGGWVEYEVNATVDLTELQGPNATKLETLAAPEGSYDKVFVYVDGIEATLENGEQVNVKLPSNKLQIEKGFTVGNGDDVSFVFDLSVHKAGKSGKYILKPVISQSGTGEEVDIEDVDEKGDEKEEHEEDESEETEDEEAEDRRDEAANGTEDEQEAATELNAQFRGPVEPGEEATLKVTGGDGPVEGAAVEVNGETIGETDADGTIAFAVPEDAEELEVTVTKGDAEVELKREFDAGADPALSVPA